MKKVNFLIIIIIICADVPSVRSIRKNFEREIVVHSILLGFLWLYKHDAMR